MGLKAISAIGGLEYSLELDAWNSKRFMPMRGRSVRYTGRLVSTRLPSGGSWRPAAGELPGRARHHPQSRVCYDYDYQGSYPALIRHLSLLQPMPVAEPVTRFETDPGQQMQADWDDLSP